MLTSIMELQLELFATVKSTKSSKLASGSRQKFTWVNTDRRSRRFRCISPSQSDCL